MRPQILYPLFRPVATLKGVGPRLATLFERLAGARVVDLLWHLPVDLVDRSYRPTVTTAEPGRIATMTVSVVRHEEPRIRRLPWRVIVADDSGELTLVYFNARADWLNKSLPVGQVRVVSGRTEHYRDTLQMPHPDLIMTVEEAKQARAAEPVYPLTQGLTPRVVLRTAAAALAQAPTLPEWQDPALLAREGWTDWKASLARAHTPESRDDLDPQSSWRRRLAYDELLASQLALAIVRRSHRRRPGRALNGDGDLQARALTAFGHVLTSSQSHAVAEIAADLASGERMLRLLQGDVGSGKTIVALLAMLTAVEAGAQAALLAPTEILARQHHATIAPLAAAAGVEVVLLTGRMKAAERRDAMARLADNRAAIAVGTHALIQDDVTFHDLALAVVDEQHRFGVHQRLALGQKGRGLNLLVMTATPIPRTLLLAGYGDLDVSRLSEKPAGRKPVETRAMPLERLDEVVAGLDRAIGAGGRAYWICPLVEESEMVDLAAATDRHAVLRQRFGERVGLVHGQMASAEREAAMAAFAAGELDILVSTTVIEVGVDVPEATVMVVEHAERFGLAQLHQLRGRVGRGSGASSCLLLYQAPLGETARRRLAIMRETDDGFRIAEEDLRLRGGGELLGTRQSGLPGFRLADLAVHADLLEIARDDARLALDRDGDLASPRGQALRVLLYLFDRDAVANSLKAG